MVKWRGKEERTMSLIKLTCACFLVTAAAAIFTIAFGYEQPASQV
jgi:hypothetical protein